MSTRLLVLCSLAILLSGVGMQCTSWKSGDHLGRMLLYLLVSTGGTCCFWLLVGSALSFNCSFFSEPGFDYLHALAPYQPLNMKAFYFPIDPGVNFFVANKLIKELQPSYLVTPTEYLPSSAQAQKDTTCLQPVSLVMMSSSL